MNKKHKKIQETLLNQDTPEPVDIDAINVMLKEHLGPFIVVGYDKQGNRVTFYNSDSPMGIDALHKQLSIVLKMSVFNAQVQ